MRDSARTGKIQGMTTTTEIPGLVVDDAPNRPPHKPRITLDRTPIAVRAALTVTNPDACAEFEREFHTAMAEADDDFDLTRVDAVVRHWWLRAIHYFDYEACQYTTEVIDRLHAGDDSDLAEATQ